MKNYEFKGGVRIGPWANSWPFGTLEVNQNSLILSDKLLKKDLVFLKEDIAQIEIKKYIPIIGYGIKILHNKKSYSSIVYFWYVGFHFDELINALKEFGWL